MTVLFIALRELRGLFNTVIAWLVLTGVFALAGAVWMLYLQVYVEWSASLAHDPYGGGALNYRDVLLGPYYQLLAITLMLVCPAISMRTFSEEYVQRTFELLLTSPISTAEIVLGKFIGSLGFIGVILAGTAVGPVSLLVWGSPDPALVWTAYLGLALLCAAILSMGMLFSAMTSNQIVALVPTFTVALLLWLMVYASTDPDSLASQIALLPHVADFFRGAMRLSDLVYFGAFIGFFLLATMQRIESNRWR